ncbi:MAG TPA: hypothetical protein VNQ77_17470 [Frankiaceae bacterium]|nr:hypothetical protein [Frankiaceae bacterium]
MGRFAASLLALALATGCANGEPASAPTTPATAAPSGPAFREYAVPAGSGPHDVAVATDGKVWYTAQRSGEVGRLDPANGRIVEVPLGDGSHPHGVVLDADGAPWVTDSGRNAIITVDPKTLRLREFPLPPSRAGANLNTPVVDRRGTVWFTGQGGVYGRVVPSTGKVEVYDAPDGRGPYGITVTPDGTVWYASLAGHHVARVDPVSGRATVLRPPTAGQGTRRVWTDSRGRVWCSQWDAGQVAVYDPATRRWREWRLPGQGPRAYAVYVDDRDVVWLSDFGSNALVRFDPETERFTSYPLPTDPANVRQIHGRPGEVWGAESAADKLVVLVTA